MLGGAVGWHVYWGPAEVLVPFPSLPPLCSHTIPGRCMCRNSLLTCHAFSVSCQPAEQRHFQLCEAAIFSSVIHAVVSVSKLIFF